MSDSDETPETPEARIERIIAAHRGHKCDPQNNMECKGYLFYLVAKNRKPVGNKPWRRRRIR